MLRRSLDIARDIASVDDMGRAVGNLTDVLIFAAARYDESADFGLDSMGTVDAPTFTGVIAALIFGDVALARYLSGRWDEALDALDRARLLPAGGAGEIALGIRAAQLQVGRGEFEKATRQLGMLHRLLDRAADIQWIAPATATEAELNIWQGNPAAARQVVADGLERIHLGHGANVSRLGPMYTIGARAAADLATTQRRRSRVNRVSRPDEGAEHTDSMRALRDEIAARWPRHLRLAEPYLALCEAEASRMEGRSDPELWATAAELFDGLGQPYVRGYARYREGEALLATRRELARARSALREAHEVTISLGAKPLRAAIEDVAGRGRIDVGPEAVASARSTAPGGLTARELEILRLVADGLTNRQIGKRVFITEKTASHHVSNILGKLGVDRRAEAAAEAVRLGLARRRT